MLAESRMCFGRCEDQLSQTGLRGTVEKRACLVASGSVHGYGYYGYYYDGPCPVGRLRRVWEAEGKPY